jgi:hypothetical protein
MKARIIIFLAFCFTLLTGQAFATDLCGAVSGTLTSAGNPYIVTCDIFVTSGNTLTIEEGVELKFNTGIKMTVDGTLDVNGSGASPVVFTSNKPLPAKGDWGGILVKNSANFQNTSVSYASSVSSEGVTTLSVTNCSFQFCHRAIIFDGDEYLGIATITGSSFSDNGYGIQMMRVNPTSTIINCTFDRNAEPIYLSDSFPTISGLTINPNQTLVNGISLDMINHNGTLYNAGYPYAGSLYVFSHVNLNIEKGVILKVGDLQVDNDSHVYLNGTAVEPVVLTSILDDDYGGDTDCNGPSSGADAGWAGYFAASSLTADHSLFRYVMLMVEGSLDISSSTFEYCENNAIEIINNETEEQVVAISNSIFRNSEKGLTMDYGAFPSAVISGCSFINNSVNGAEFDDGASNITMLNCDFSGNGTAVYADATSTVNLGSGAVGGNNQFVCNGINVNNLNPATLMAENNWWGDSPPDAAKILGAVDYTPYLTGPVRDILTDLLAAPSGLSDIALSWADLTNGCGYRVFRSALPDQNFADISGPLAAAQFTDSGAASTPGPLFYKVELE